MTYFEIPESASKLHRKIGEALFNGPFASYKLHQEYPVHKVCPWYPHTNHRYDWVITDLKLVIEGHGAQHYKPVKWTGDTTDEEAELVWIDVKIKDDAKQTAAIEAGYLYLAIPYYDIDNLTSQYILDKYLVLIADSHMHDHDPESIHPTHTKWHEYYEAREERARRNKQWRKEHIRK